MHVEYVLYNSVYVFYMICAAMYEVIYYLKQWVLLNELKMYLHILQLHITTSATVSEDTGLDLSLSILVEYASAQA